MVAPRKTPSRAHGKRFGILVTLCAYVLNGANAADTSDTVQTVQQAILEVDVPMKGMPPTMQNGVYQRIGATKFERHLDSVDVRFVVSALESTVVEHQLMTWLIEGYECDSNRSCRQILDTNVQAKAVSYSNGNDTFMVISDKNLESARALRGRSLQLETFNTIGPPKLPPGTLAYFDCSFAANNPSKWCCKQSTLAPAVDVCWSLDVCQDDYSFLTGQTLICCTNSAADCIATYDSPLDSVKQESVLAPPPVDTSTQTVPAPSPSQVTDAPSPTPVTTPPSSPSPAPSSNSPSPSISSSPSTSPSPGPSPSPSSPPSSSPSAALSTSPTVSPTSQPASSPLSSPPVGPWQAPCTSAPSPEPRSNCPADG